ncbi:MAG: ribosome biogenesis GTP-binding protein YsxC [Elusimicrobia bacterium]|nr:ribosome biogenesis GTP-binding protein YsxC [Elusimicrobiota bacterium]
MHDALKAARYLLSETDPARLGESKAEVTFVGRSNVGKSSLLNALCGGALARVSNTPGRTRTINVFLAGSDRWLVDLPGYGFAGGDREEIAGWKSMLEGYLTGRAAMKMIFLLVDAKVGPTKLDLMMAKWLDAKRLPWRVVATKADQVKPSRGISRRREVAESLGLASEDLAWVSAKEDVGMRELRGEVSALLGLGLAA